MTTTVTPIATSVRSLQKIKERLQKTHRLQISAVDEEINNIQNICPHKQFNWEQQTGFGKNKVCSECGLLVDVDY